MANNDFGSLGGAYSILGQATTAEYNRRKKEEDKERRRARRDQLLGYFLAPIGQQVAKGVSDIISAPFEKPVEKLLQTEQGRVLNKDLKAITRHKTGYDALGKKITTDYSGDSYSYHLERVEDNIEEETRREFLADLRISPKQLEGDTEAAIQYSRLLQNRLKKAPEIAREEDNQYLTGLAALSNYKTGQDAKDVLGKVTPYSKGLLQGGVRGVKRLLTGSSPFSGPTDEEKKNAVEVARQGLNLTGMESEKLLNLVKQGATVKRLEREMDVMAEFKDPEFQSWWGKSKNQTYFISQYHQNSLSKSMHNVVRSYYAEHKKYPDQETAISLLGEKLSSSGLNLAATAQSELVNSVITSAAVVQQRDIFRESYIRGFSRQDNYLEARSEDKKRVDAAWERLSEAAVSQSQRNFASFYGGLSIEQADAYVSEVNATDQMALIRQNAIAALNNLDYTGGEDQKTWYGRSYVTDKNFTGALRDSGFKPNFEKLPSNENVRSVQPMVRNALEGTSAQDVTVLVDLENEQVKALSKIEDEEELKETISKIKNAGYNVPSSLEKALLSDTDSKIIKDSGLDYIRRFIEGEHRTETALKDLLEKSSTSIALGGTPKVNNLTSWFDALHSFVSSDRTQHRNIFTGEDERTGLPFREVTASSALKPIPLEQTSDLLETPSTSDKQQGLLAEIRKGKDWEPASGKKRKPSLLSNHSPFSIKTAERSNSFEIPNVNTKEGRGMISTFREEVKEQLGASLSNKEAKIVIKGLVDPTDEQLQIILSVLEKNAPANRVLTLPDPNEILVDPDEKTIEKLLDVLSQTSRIGY